MAFTAEDGTGVIDANGYIDDTFFDTYFGDRGNTAAVALATADKQVAIVKASDYIDSRFGTVFRGWKSTSYQGLEWPRTDAYDDDDYALDEVPSQLQKATAEYAWRAYNLGILAPDPALAFNTRDSIGAGSTESATNIKGYRTKVGPIEIEQKFSDAASSGSSSQTATGNDLAAADMIPAYPTADMWLNELITAKGATADIERG